MKIEIMKFGGMAMKTKSSRERIADIIKKSDASKILVVVSAMGRSGFPYATDTLNELVKENSVTKKEKDRLLSIGEIIASIVLSGELNVLGLKAYSLSIKEIGLLADNNYGSAYVKEMNNEHIVALFEQYDILICPGFVSLNEENEPTTLNRGGSDLTAVLLSSVLSIDEITLYKDVDGVYPSRPPLDQRITIYKSIDYNEQLALSNIGLNIVQKDAILEAQKMHKKIIIKNFHTLKLGTIICDTNDSNKVIGINSSNNLLMIATFYPKEIIEDIRFILNNNHIYIKEESIEDNKIVLKLQSSQIFLARRLLLLKYYIKH